jgi:DNA-binding transcriptional ArsR family regulator
MWPRQFIDGLIQTLLRVSHNRGALANGAAPAALAAPGDAEPREGTWGFATNHGVVLLLVALDSGSTVREMAAAAGLTERAVVAILNQLEDEGIIERERQGRRNVYSIRGEALRHFPRWSPGEWKLPDELIEVAMNALSALGHSAARQQPAAVSA